MIRYCQTCGRRATYRSAAAHSDGRRRSDNAHDLCGRCAHKATEQSGIEEREQHRIAREIEQTWAEHGGN